jgi:hypothetical protein
MFYSTIDVIQIKKQMLSKTLQARYLANTWDQIVSRIMSSDIVRNMTVKQLSSLEHVLSTKTFIPAGNTLTYNADLLKTNYTKELRPNCSIIHNVSVDQARHLWERSIGFGTTCNANENPVHHIHQLQDAWNSMNLGHRPMRGNMYSYPIWGKYINEFIALKSSEQRANQIPAFNISVRVNTKMDIPVEVLRKISENAWKTGDPGVIFEDRINSNMPFLHKRRRMQTVVPCGEQSMYNGEYCTLGSINLNSSELKNSDGTMSPERLAHATRIAVRFLDHCVDVIDLKNEYRRIGLGVMGWADYLGSLGLAYDSNLALEHAKWLSMYFGAVARNESIRLALEKGTFPKWNLRDYSLNKQMIRNDSIMIPNEFLSYSHGTRNISTTCIAPTGGISLLTGNRGFSIEPFFEDAGNINYLSHLNMVSAWQQGICNSISKTINFPQNSTPNDLYQSIMYSYVNPYIKSLTMYRNGSRSGQPI